MRALVLLLVCIVFLASIQASYLAVEARQRRDYHLVDEPHHKHQAAAQSSPPASSKNTDEAIPEMNIPEDVELHDGKKVHSVTHDHNKHGDRRRNHHHRRNWNKKDEKQTPNDIHEPIFDITIHNEHRQIIEPQEEDLSHMGPEVIKPELMIPDQVKDEKPALDMVDTEEVEPEDEEDGEEEEIDVTEDEEDMGIEDADEEAEVSIYDRMMGDRPARGKGQGQRGRNRETKRNRNRNKKGKPKNKKKKGNRKMQRRPRPNKAGGKNNVTCITEADCGQNSCCVPVRRGVKVCRPAEVVVMGRKCSNSCVCQSGLQCFRQHRRRESKKSIFGRCVNPQENDKPGIYLTEAPPTGTTSTIKP